MLYGKDNKISWLIIAICLNPYFFGKCSTAVQEKVMHVEKTKSLNPYFFGKCSTASIRALTNQLTTIGLNPYFFGKCSTAPIL